MSDYDERLRDVETDVGYALGELKDMQDNLTDTDLASRLEGVEARLKELADILYEYTREAAYGPHFAGEDARLKLTSFLGA